MAEAPGTAGDMRLYFAVTFWGEEYRRYFLDFCLASLLAPGNLSAVAGQASARLLIATTDADWAELQTEPVFLRVAELIAIEHLPFDPALRGNAHSKMLTMSDAHRQLASRMFEDRARGMFLYPDMIAAAGFVERVQALWRGGAKAIMFMNVRFANEGLIDELGSQGRLQPGAPLVLSPKELVRLTIRHMHSEMARGGFENACEDEGSSSFFWVVSPGEDLLFHCGGWIPLLLDYERLDCHDDSTFDDCTLDGDYVTRNLSDAKDVYFVRDTSELFMISFTHESSVSYSLAPILKYRIPALRRALKIINAHEYLYGKNILDWLRKEQFCLPVRFIGGDSSERRWRKTEAKARKVAQRIAQGGDRTDHVFRTLYRAVAGGLLIVRLVPAKWNRIFGLVRRAVSGDRAAWLEAKWRLRRVTCFIAGRPFNDPLPGAKDGQA